MGRRELGSGLGNAAGQPDAQAGGKGGIRQDMQFQPPRINEVQAEIRLRQSRVYDTAKNSGPVEKAGKRFHPDHAERRKLGSGFGNTAGQLDAQAGGKGGLRKDMQFQPPSIDEAQAEIRLRQSRFL